MLANILVEEVSGRISKTLRFKSRNKKFLTFHKIEKADHGFIKLTDFIIVFSAFPKFHY